MGFQKLGDWTRKIIFYLKECYVRHTTHLQKVLLDLDSRVHLLQYSLAVPHNANFNIHQHFWYFKRTKKLVFEMYTAHISRCQHKYDHSKAIRCYLLISQAVLYWQCVYISKGNILQDYNTRVLIELFVEVIALQDSQESTIQNYWKLQGLQSPAVKVQKRFFRAKTNETALLEWTLTRTCWRGL